MHVEVKKKYRTIQETRSSRFKDVYSREYYLLLLKILRGPMTACCVQRTLDILLPIYFIILFL